MQKLVLIIVLLSMGSNLYAKPPKVSGNYEQGSRYAVPYDEIEYPTWWFEEIEDIVKNAY